MGNRALSGLLFAILAILLTAAGAAAATDLHPLLAGPPSADWIDVPSSPKTLVGDFTAHDYAAYIQASGNSPGATEFDLNLYGFTRGYALEWEQRGSRHLLIERAFAFRHPTGAPLWYSLLKLVDTTSGKYTHDVPMPPSVPNSSGALFTWPDGTLQNRIGFWKGNVAYVVHTDSLTNDLSALGVSQAVTEYANAPSQTEGPPGAGQAVNDWLRNIGIAVGAVVGAVALTTTLTSVFLARPLRPATFPIGGPTTSPAGAYWWDGRPRRAPPPPR